MDEQGVPGQTQTQKGSLQMVEARTGSLGGIQRNCPSSQGSSQESQSPDKIKSGQGRQGQQEKHIYVAAIFDPVLACGGWTLSTPTFPLSMPIEIGS